MNTTSCFIRKNTQHLLDKLRDIGYEILEETIYGRPYLVAIAGRVVGVFTQKCGYNFGAYYCGDNEPLFLALAALRDDSDYMQWFVIMRYNEAVEKIDDTWFLCERNTFDIDSRPNAWVVFHHKATKEELINHFSSNP